MSVELLQLSSYVRPDIIETNSKEYVLNGAGNSFYYYLIDRYNGSPTHRTIVDSYAKYIYGKGLMSIEQASKTLDFLKVKSLLSKKDLRAVCADFSLFYEASVELIYKAGKLEQMVHVPKNMIAPSKIDDDGDITSYWYCRDFRKTTKYPPKEFKAFGFGKTPKDGSLIYVFKDYQVGKTYYSDPGYLPGLPYAELEEEIGAYCVNHIKNGLSFGYIINFNNGEPQTDEEKNEIRNNIKRKLSGSENAGKFILAWNDSKENACTIEALEVSDAHQQYQFLSSEATQKILISHGVTSSVMFGISKDGGLGNNAQEMETAFNEAMINVIQPKKEVLLDGLMEILRSENIFIDLDFIPLRNIVQPTQNAQTALSLSRQEEADSAMAEMLIELGEEITDEWECFDERQAHKDQTLTETGFKLALAYVPSNFPERKSDQDTTLFKVRYEYAGNPNPQRSFCAKMMAAGRVFRKEDIEAAGRKAVNAGFGPYGSDNYDIFLYKGGPNCRHFWQRKLYLKKDNGVISAAQAREMLNSLEPSERKDARIEPNDPLVAKRPEDMPNNGYLEKR